MKLDDIGAVALAILDFIGFILASILFLPAFLIVTVLQDYWSKKLGSLFNV